jgi:hypothetical protein
MAIRAETGKWWKGVLPEPTAYRPASGKSFSGRVGSAREVIPGVPTLSDEAIGWLTHLNRKVGYGGTWRITDKPHESWDDRSFTPMGNFPRYDFSWNQWSLALMAETTPAWRETYSTILKFMSDRYLEYWSLYEWLEHKGDDPMRDQYPPEWKPRFPPGLFGKYNSIGWAGNGYGPFEYDPDPVRGGGQNLMYKGYLDLTLSLYAYVSGDDTFDRPFDVVYDDDTSFRYDHRELNELIARQWRDYWPGIACEAGKIFPWCNNLTGTAVRLFDIMHGTNLALPYYNWKRYARRNYFPVDETTGRVDRVDGFYDPVIDWHGTTGGSQAATSYAPVLWHAIGLDRELAERIYEGMLYHFLREQPDGTAYLAPVESMDIDASAPTGLAAACALELGDYETHSALRAWIERNYEPTWTDDGEFYFGFGLDEQWPRGQYNGWVMPAVTIARPGQWHDLLHKPQTSKFREPTLEGVDFPTVLVRQAYYDRQDRTLSVAITSAARSSLGTPTTLEITNLVDRAEYETRVDGSVVEDLRSTNGKITISTSVGPHTVSVQRI